MSKLIIVWIIPYPPILSKLSNRTSMLNLTIPSNYICKYVTKENDMTVIGVGAESTIDEVT